MNINNAAKTSCEVVMGFCVGIVADLANEQVLSDAKIIGFEFLLVHVFQGELVVATFPLLPVTSVEPRLAFFVAAYYNVPRPPFNKVGPPKGNPLVLAECGFRFIVRAIVKTSRWALSVWCGYACKVYCVIFSRSINFNGTLYGKDGWVVVHLVGSCCFAFCFRHCRKTVFVVSKQIFLNFL